MQFRDPPQKVSAIIQPSTILYRECVCALILNITCTDLQSGNLQSQAGASGDLQLDNAESAAVPDLLGATAQSQRSRHCRHKRLCGSEEL